VPAVSGFVPATRKIVQGQEFSDYQAASASFLSHQEREEWNTARLFLFIYPNTHLKTLHKRLYCCSPTPFPSFCLSRFKILSHERRAPPHHVARDFWVKSFIFVCGLSKYTCGDTLSHMQILVCVYINQYRCHCTVALNAMMLLYIWPSHTYYIHHLLVGTRVRTYHNERLTRVIVLPAASLSIF
jgi:hypothetical protein